MKKIKTQEYLKSINRKSIFILQYESKDERYHVVEKIEDNQIKNREKYYENKKDAIIAAATKTKEKASFYFKHLWRYENIDKFNFNNFFIVILKKLTPKEHQKKYYSAQRLFLFSKHYLNKDIEEIETETQVTLLPEYIFLNKGQTNVFQNKVYYKLNINIDLNQDKPLIIKEEKIKIRKIKQEFYQDKNEDFLRTNIIIYLEDFTSFSPLNSEIYISKNSKYYILENYQDMKKLKSEIIHKFSINK